VPIAYAQQTVARAMARTMRDEDLGFVLNLGDNFYYNGVKDIHDSRFEVTQSEL